jgi:hypothetical protein
MVRYEYDFDCNYWYYRIKDSDNNIYTIIHNSLFDSKIPEDYVLKIAEEHFSNEFKDFTTYKGLVSFANNQSLDYLIGITKVGGLCTLYDFKTEKFLIKPTTKSKMTLEQKKTLIKMIHEI